jgi:hypothetical protein
MNSFPSAAIAGAALLLAVGTAQSSPVTLIDASTQGLYNATLGDLGAPSGRLPWFPAPFTFGGTPSEIFGSAPDLTGVVALGDWLTDPASPGGGWSGPQSIPAAWAVNTEVAIIYAFDAGPGLTGLNASFAGIDNGIHLWLNGEWRFGVRDPVGIGVALNLGNAGPGVNYLQILLEGGGVTRFQGPLLTGTVVPVPAAGWLLMSGAGALAATRRRRGAGSGAPGLPGRSWPDA